MGTLYKASLAGILFCILLVTLIDVIGRYAFDSPLFGADDLVRFGMALLVYAALPGICRRGSHITVDLLSSRWSVAAQTILARLFGLVAAVFLSVLAWRLAEVGLIALEDNEHSPLRRLPMAPLAFFMAACTALAAAYEARKIVSPHAAKADGDGLDAGERDDNDADVKAA